MSAGAHKGQMRVSEPLELEGGTGGCEVPSVGQCWEPNSIPWEEQQVFLTTESSLSLLNILDLYYRTLAGLLVIQF